MQKILLFFLLMFLSSCATVYQNSYDGSKANYRGDLEILAKQTSFELAKKYPAGQTQISIEDKKSNFAIVLEQELRKSGFTVVDKANLHLYYILDEIQDESRPTVYLKVQSSLGDVFGFVRVLEFLSSSQNTFIEENKLEEYQAPETYETNQNEITIQPEVQPLVETILPIENKLLSEANQEIASSDISLRPSTNSEWSLIPGSLHRQLNKWAEYSGYTIAWQARNDLDLESFVNFEGNFISAINQLFSTLNKNGFTFRATIYEKNKTLVVLDN